MITSCTSKKTSEAESVVSTQDEDIQISVILPTDTIEHEIEEVQSVTDEQFSVYNVTFKNETITINAFITETSPLEHGGVHYLDKIVFNYDGITQTIHTDGMLFATEAGSGYFAAEDYNFDGFMDIKVGLTMSYSGTYNVYLYNPQTKSYSLQNELSRYGDNLPSGHGDIEINEERKTIKRFETVGNHEYQYDSREYKWENGQLKLIRTERVIETTRTIRTLQDNGTWAETTEPSEYIYAW
ncbi:MAG: hypothetical protein FWD13_09645 [Treponema sp.]|nr:hypothetical protein [Treponema sp.]